MEEVCEVVVTGPDRAWLTDFALGLVEDRLAACGQLLAPVRSVYRWAGRVVEETEARVALHTRADLVDVILQRVRAVHPYDVPCVLVLPVTGGNPEYLRWVLDETAPPEG